LNLPRRETQPNTLIREANEAIIMKRIELLWIVIIGSFFVQLLQIINERLTGLSSILAFFAAMIGLGIVMYYLERKDDRDAAAIRSARQNL
jgi:hypothetical protein